MEVYSEVYHVSFRIQGKWISVSIQVILLTTPAAIIWLAGAAGVGAAVSRALYLLSADPDADRGRAGIGGPDEHVAAGYGS